MGIETARSNSGPVGVLSGSSQRETARHRVEPVFKARDHDRPVGRVRFDTVADPRLYNGWMRERSGGVVGGGMTEAACGNGT